MHQENYSVLKTMVGDNNSLYIDIQYKTAMACESISIIIYSTISNTLSLFIAPYDIQMMSCHRKLII